MSVALNPLIPKDGRIVISDGAGSPISLTVLYEDGDLQAAGLMKDQQEVQAFRRRGTFYSGRQIGSKDIEFSFTCHALGILGDGTTALMGDVILRKGVWVAATSTLPLTAGDAFCVQLAWTGERTDFGASADSSLTLKYCHLTADFSEGLPGKWSIKGTAFIYSTDWMTVV